MRVRPRGSASSRIARLRSATGALAGARALELAAAAAAVALYLPAIGYGFVFDDFALIREDGSPVALGPGLPYRPLRYASYVLDSWLGGSSAVFHAHNVALHALVVAFVVALARRLGALPWAALAAGLLVAVHPLAVEAAAYVSGRRDLLCVALGLAALHAHLSGRLGASLGLLVAATMAKESGLVFVAPLVAASLAGLDDVSRGLRERRRPAARTSPARAGAGSTARVARNVGAIALAASAAFALAVVYGAVGPWAPPAGFAAWAMPGHVVAHYLGSLAGAHALAPEYPSLAGVASRIAGGDGAARLAGLAAGAVVAASTVVAFAACARFARQRAAARAFAVAWTLAVLSALGLWGGLHEPGADRHAYLLLPAFGVAAALLVPRAIDSRPFAKGAAAAVATALFVLAAGATRAQMKAWQSERTLWIHTLAHAPSSPRAHANLARVRAADGQWRAAVAHLDAALEADPGNALLYVSRASVRCAEGRAPLARRDLRRARERGAHASILRGIESDCGAPRRAPETSS